MLHAIAQALITMADAGELMEAVARELPRLGMPSCYLSVYERDAVSTGWSRLILACDGEKRFELEEIVVSANRAGEAIENIAKNATVITSEDIQQSTAKNIADLLSRETSLNLRSVTGNEGKSGVDIRGMGDTYVSNVIVMVDGFRLNATDMSGADLLSVPLGQVERIEIVRGGGAVLYARTSLFV